MCQFNSGRDCHHSNSLFHHIGRMYAVYRSSTFVLCCMCTVNHLCSILKTTRKTNLCGNVYLLDKRLTNNYALAKINNVNFYKTLFWLTICSMACMVRRGFSCVSYLDEGGMLVYDCMENPTYMIKFQNSYIH